MKSKDKLIKALVDQDGHVLYKARRYAIHPLIEALTIAICSFTAIFFTTYFIYHHALNAQINELKQGLLRTASVISTLVDGDLHKTFSNQEQEETVAYQKAITPLAKALKADPSLSFIYTVILQDGSAYFILDPTPEGDADGDGLDDKSHIMEPYFEADTALFDALTHQHAAVMNEPASDRWGAFLSAYVPFYNSDGAFVGVLGVDITASHYLERLAPIKRATVRTMVTEFFISFLIGALVWFTRNFSLVLNDKRWRLLNHLETQQDYELVPVKDEMNHDAHDDTQRQD